MKRWLYTIGAVLTLVTIGGQCRGSLAQTKGLQEFPTVEGPPKLRTTPMSQKEWQEAYDACVKDDTMAPVILASRSQGLSAGIICVPRGD